MSRRRYQRPKWTLPERSTMDDFSGGIIGGISDRRVRPRHLRKSDNLIGRPYRALRVRPGSRDISTAVVGYAPHSLAKYYASGGAAKLFVAADNKWYEATSSAYTLQSLPITPSSTDKWTSENLNGILWTTQRGGSQRPLMYNGGWLTANLPVPGATLTLTAANTVGPPAGALGNNFDAGGTTGTYYYRLRWRHVNGCSTWSTAQSVALTAASSHNSVNVTTIPLGSRSDYTGWSLYRTKALNQDGANGVFYLVAQGTATSYLDLNADASLFYASDDGIHTAPPHFDGLIPFAGRLCGWAGSTLYMSQLPGDLEDTGLCNFDPQLAFNFAKDDGDSIQTCVVVGDQLVVLKRRSVFVLDGNMPENFQVRPLLSGSAARGAEAGCVGPRAACVVGQIAYFLGDSGMFRYVLGRGIEPFGWTEVGHYVDTINKAYLDDVLLVNYLGDFLLAWYPGAGQSYNTEMLVYDVRFKHWDHWTNWYAKDALIQKDSAFSGATLVFCDPRTSPVTTLPVTNPSFIAWRDDRAAATHIYVGSKSSDGTDAYAANGVQAEASSTGTGAVLEVAVCSDGLDGCIVAWTDRRSGAIADVYAQRFNATGVPQWTANGVNIRAAATGATVSLPRIDMDGAGGAVIAWYDARAAANGPYVQRINSSGAVQWTANGVRALTGTTFTTDALALLSNLDGSCYVSAHAASNNVALQRLSSAGALGFGASGVSFVGQSFPALCTDTVGGVYIAYGGTSKAGICYVHRYDSGGTAHSGWGANGVALPGAGSLNVNANQLALCPDGAGGCIAAWVDSASSSLAPYAQRVNSNATVAWGAGGVALQTRGMSSNLDGLRLVSDGSGGAIAGWVLGSTTADVYAQRVSNGAAQWGTGAVAVANGANAQNSMNLCTDGGGGAVMAWADARSGTRDIYAQRMNPDGSFQWTSGGVVVCNATASQDAPAIAFTNAPSSGLSQATTTGSHVWAGFDSFLDEKAAGGTGGNAVPVYIETPMVDDFSPSSWKRYERLQVYIESPVTTVSASLVLDPSDVGLQTSLRATSVGAEWATDASDTNPLAAVWDVSDWGTEYPQPLTTGLSLKATGQRYSLRIACATTGDFIYYGHELDYVLLPERRLDR